MGNIKMGIGRESYPFFVIIIKTCYICTEQIHDIMKVYDVFKEYIWLVQTIHKHGMISLEEINELWRNTDMSGGLAFSRSTFNRHKDAIQDIFGLYIDCDRRNGYRYYICNTRALEEDSIQNWLLSTISVNNIISESLSLQDRIQIESIPDNRFLSTFIDAMKTSRKVEIMYRKFGADDARKLSFEPYGLKVYQKRWYVLGRFSEYFGIFSFDRIEQVTILKEKFKIDKDFNIKDFFNECYGIMQDSNVKTERVLLRAYGNEVHNLRTLPLHSSQKEVSATDYYTDFELYLKPTLDFSGKLLSRGEWIEVLEPEWLRNDIVEMHRNALKRYEK